MTTSSCNGDCEHCASEHKTENCKLEKRLDDIGRTLVVMSGKGGVGKSTVAVNLACALAARGQKVGLLDVDLHGPSVPGLLGVGGAPVIQTEEGILPVEAGPLKVMSVGFLVRDPDDAIIWRGPAKMAVIRQLLEDVCWGPLDYLVIDCPPGTGDEPLSVVQLVTGPKAAVIVTTPQRVAADDVARSIGFCRKLDLPVCGLLENMSGFVCPHCGKVTDIFASGGGEALAARMGVPFAGKIPIDPAVCQAGDAGTPFALSADSPTGKAFASAVDRLMAAFPE